jgi:DNA-binding SARP family transcriptional activator
VTRAVRVMKGLVALVALVALMGAVPWALWHYVGWPLPHRLPSWSQFTTTLGQHGIADSTLLKALACVVWLCWAILAVSVVVELDAAARGRAARRLAVIGPLQPLVGQLLAAIVVAAVALAPRPGVAPRPLAAAVTPGRRPVAVAAVALVSDPRPAPVPTTAATAQPSGGAQQAGSTYVVQRNNTLWGIAERELGDPLRWTEIYALNEGRPEPGGATLDDPNWIYPGWTLLLPATTPPSPAPAVPAVPSSAPPPTEPGPTPAAPTSPTTSPPHGGVGAPNHGKHEAAASVELPSGSVVALSFAAGVLSAIAIGRLRRRHGYRASPPEPGRALGPPPLGPTISRLAAALTFPDDETDTGAADEQPRFEDDAPSLPEDDAAHRERPDLLEIGERDGTNVTAVLSESGGIALYGDGADDVARAWVAALLTRSGSIAVEVLLTTDTMGRLFPGLGEVPGIRVVEGSEQVVRILEAEVLGRTRKLEAEGLDDVVAYRQANPAEPIPSILAVIGALPDGWAPRLRSTLEVGSHLGIGALFLDETEVAAAIRLELDRDRVVAVEPPDRAGDLLGVRLFSLDAAEANDALRVLARAEFRPTSEENPEWTEVIERMEHPPPTAEPWPVEAVERRAAEAPVAVQVLGPLAITVCGTTIGRGLRSVAKELLTFYLLHPEGATVEQAVDTLWPDTDPSQVHRQFWTAAGNLRTRLREPADTEARVLDQAGEVYRLDPEVVSADLWEFQHALADAARSPDDEAAAAALRRAVDAFGGDVAQGSGWLWIEPAREDLHRRAVDAHLRLAELEEGLGNPAAAEAVLERVVDLDRYGEEPYRRLMVLQAKSGRIDAVKATWRLLQRRLLDLDLDPDPSSGELYRSLTGSDGATSRGDERSGRSSWRS